ncbi:MAG TPA: hypothetical protein PKL13_02965 [bacterium]|nr:hypothetical protein [bacterium]
MKFLKSSKLFYISGIFLLFIEFFCVFSFIEAVSDWTEPNVDPPAGNIDLPLNQGAVGQYKKGSLTIGSNSVIEDGYYFKVLNGSALFQGLVIDEKGNLIMSPDSQILLSSNTSKINLSGGSSINLVGSSINLSSRSNIVGNTDGGDIIALTNKAKDTESGAGIYSFAPSGLAIDARADTGIGVYARSEKGFSIYSQSADGFAGRFDGRVTVYDSEGNKYVDFQDGHILAPFGLSTVIPRAVSIPGNPVYDNNTILTKKLCFSDTDASGVQTGSIECMTETMGGPESENSFIWNVGSGSHFSGTQYQTADMSLNGLVSVNCQGSVEANPTKGIKIGEASYIYDSSCGLPGGSTLQIQSQEPIKISSANSIALKVNLSGSEKGIKINNLGNVGIGTDNPTSKLTVYDGDIKMDNDKSIYVGGVDSSHIYIGNYDDGNGFIFGNVDNNKTASLSVEGSVAANALCMGDDCRSSWEQIAYSLWSPSGDNIFNSNSGGVGIGTNQPEEKLHINGAIYLGEISAPSPTTNRLYNVAGNLFWNGLQINNIQQSYWLFNGGNLYTTSTVTKVGIGTNSPEKSLHIKTSSGNAEINIQSASSPKWGIYQDDATDDLSFWNVDNRMTITNEGRVGIGISNPGANLEIYNNIGDSRIRLKSNNTNQVFWDIFNVGDTNMLSEGDLRIQYSGNSNPTVPVITIKQHMASASLPPRVGINTENPASELSVNGTLTVRNRVCFHDDNELICINKDSINSQCPPWRVIVHEDSDKLDEFITYQECAPTTNGVILKIPEICDGTQSDMCRYIFTHPSTHPNQCEEICKEFGFWGNENYSYIEQNIMTITQEPYNTICYGNAEGCYYKIGQDDSPHGTFYWHRRFFTSNEHAGGGGPIGSCTCFN